MLVSCPGVDPHPEASKKFFQLHRRPAELLKNTHLALLFNRLVLKGHLVTALPFILLGAFHELPHLVFTLTLPTPSTEICLIDKEIRLRGIK